MILLYRLFAMGCAAASMVMLCVTLDAPPNVTAALAVVTACVVFVVTDPGDDPDRWA